MKQDTKWMEGPARRIYEGEKISTERMLTERACMHEAGYKVNVRPSERDLRG